MVLPNKSLANIARCILDSADKTNLSRFFSEAQWFQDQVNERRLGYLLAQTTAVRRPAAESALILDDTLCEHVGTLFEYVERRYNHLLFDGWYLTEALVAAARRHKKDWISLLKKKRNLESYSFTLKDAQGQPVALPGPHIAVQKLIPLIPATAYRPVTVDDQTYWTFSRTVRIPGLGKLRLVISLQTADLTGAYVVLVTLRLDWSAQPIIAAYLGRWPHPVGTRTFYQDGKGCLGLDEYRMGNAEAIQKHWCLVFVAYSFLHLDCLPPSPTKGNLPTKTIREACRQQAQALIQALMLHVHDQLQQGLPATDVFVRLFAKQGVALAT
jgi:hypothetical protein